MAVTTQQSVLAAIIGERRRQDKKWGVGHDPGDGVLLAVLVEEIGETARALCGHYPDDPDEDQLFEELIQVAAVAVQWLETLERRAENGRQSSQR